MDAEIIDKSRESGRLDGTTALAAVHIGPVLSVANAGDEGSGGSRSAYPPPLVAGGLLSGADM